MQSTKHRPPQPTAGSHLPKCRWFTMCILKYTEMIDASKLSQALGNARQFIAGSLKEQHTSAGSGLTNRTAPAASWATCKFSRMRLKSQAFLATVGQLRVSDIWAPGQGQHCTTLLGSGLERHQVFCQLQAIRPEIDSLGCSMAYASIPSFSRRNILVFCTCLLRSPIAHCYQHN